MRVSTAVAGAALLLILGPAPAQSQEWSEYLAYDDFFSINFPKEPTIQATTYETEYALKLPARVYSADDAGGKYAITVVDWREAPKQHEARFEACKANAGDLRGGENPALCGNSTRNEIRSAVLHAMAKYVTSGNQVTGLTSHNAEGVEGMRVQLTNKDGSRTFAVAIWHEYRLYVAEATAPKGAPPPGIFPVALGFLDQDGKRVRYAGPYSPLYPVPQRSR